MASKRRLALVHRVEGRVEEAHGEEHPGQPAGRLRRVERLQPELAGDVGLEAGHRVPDVVRLVEVRAHELELVAGRRAWGWPRGRGRSRSCGRRRRARASPAGSFDSSARSTAGGGLSRSAAAPRGSRPKCSGICSRTSVRRSDHPVGDLEDAIEVIGVPHQVDEAPERRARRRCASRMRLTACIACLLVAREYASYRSHRQLAFPEAPRAHGDRARRRERSRASSARRPRSTASSTRPLAFSARRATTGRAPTASRSPPASASGRSTSTSRARRRSSRRSSSATRADGALIRSASSRSSRPRRSTSPCAP